MGFIAVLIVASIVVWIFSEYGWLLLIVAVLYGASKFLVSRDRNKRYRHVRSAAVLDRKTQYGNGLEKTGISTGPLWSNPRYHYHKTTYKLNEKILFEVIYDDGHPERQWVDTNSDYCDYLLSMSDC